MNAFRTFEFSMVVFVLLLIQNGVGSTLFSFFSTWLCLWQTDHSQMTCLYLQYTLYRIGDRM